MLFWAAKWQAEGKAFFGLIYLPAGLGIGACVGDSELFAHASEQAETENRVVYLPL